MNEQKLKTVQQWRTALQEAARTAVEALAFETPINKAVRLSTSGAKSSARQSTRYASWFARNRRQLRSWRKRRGIG